MTDSPRRDGPVPPRQPQQPQQYGWQSETDPAYAYPPPLFGNYYQSPADANDTQQLPANWSQGGYDPSREATQSAVPWSGGVPPQQPPYQTSYLPPDPGGEPPPPGGPGPRMWLWVLAGVAVLLVIGMVAALFIVSGSEEQTVVAPPLVTATPATTTPRTTTAPTTTTTSPPSDSTTAGPTESASPGATEQVVYNVSGTGKAINITYIDEGGVLQTEFNAMLPWTKTVQLAAPAKDSASVSIVTFGREVSCTITVGGVQVSTKTGTALTVCSGRL